MKKIDILRMHFPFPTGDLPLFTSDKEKKNDGQKDTFASIVTRI